VNGRGEQPTVRRPFTVLSQLPMEEAFLMIAMRMRGIKYEYGGQDPNQSLDCSGLVVQMFRELGLPIEDMTAGGLHEKLFTLSKPPDNGPRVCCLFWRKHGQSEDNHVSFVVASVRLHFICLDTTAVRGKVDFDIYDIDNNNGQTITPAYLDVSRILPRGVHYAD